MTDNATYTLRPIAHIKTPLKSKFGIPRQSGIISDIPGEIIFLPEFRNPDALRGIEGYSHLWLIWQFSETAREDGGWSPTVRPPRLGGNTRMGVFATRSPYRPNALGLSSVKLERIEQTNDRGTVLHVRGADLLDGTPIYDIKPYLSFTDSHPDAVCGFADEKKDLARKVEIPADLLEKIPPCDRDIIRAILEGDPRPSYQDDPSRIYGFPYGDYEVKFTANGDTIAVCGIE